VIRQHVQPRRLLRLRIAAELELYKISHRIEWKEIITKKRKETLNSNQSTKQEQK
jgi:hypothetical protein